MHWESEERGEKKKSAREGIKHMNKHRKEKKPGQRVYCEHAGVVCLGVCVCVCVCVCVGGCLQGAGRDLPDENLRLLIWTSRDGHWHPYIFVYTSLLVVLDPTLFCVVLWGVRDRRDNGPSLSLGVLLCGTGEGLNGAWKDDDSMHINFNFNSCERYPLRICPNCHCSVQEATAAGSPTHADDFVIFQGEFVVVGDLLAHGDVPVGVDDNLLLLVDLNDFGGTVGLRGRAE